MRHEDWTNRLNVILTEAEKKPFMWGKHDCCLFAANVVKELTGNDYASELKGTYNNAKEALKVLSKLGGVKEIAAKALGDEILPALAQRGDIVLIESDEHGETLAVCIDNRCAAPGLEGLNFVSMEKAITAWRVK